MTDINIPLEECPADSILAVDIVNDSGFVILKAGTILTESKIETLSKYGVENISIKSEVKLTPEELEEKKKKIEENINKRMRKCNMTNEMTQFKNILIEYYCRDFM